MTSRASVARNVGGGVRVIIIPNKQAIDNLLSGRSGDLKRVMAGFASRATVKAKELAATRVKTRSGNYRRSIHASFPRTDEFRINADAPYAAGLETGFAAHEIHARNVPLLHFYWENQGRWIQTPSVNHPGSSGYNILTDAVLETAKSIGF